MPITHSRSIPVCTSRPSFGVSFNKVGCPSNSSSQELESENNQSTESTDISHSFKDNTHEGHSHANNTQQIHPCLYIET